MSGIGRVSLRVISTGEVFGGGGGCAMCMVEKGITPVAAAACPARVSVAWNGVIGSTQGFCICIDTEG